MHESLTAFPGTDSATRMGRPPLHVRETKVRITDDQKSRIEALAGKSRMAAWIRDAIDVELDRQEAENGGGNARSRKAD